MDPADFQGTYKWKFLIPGMYITSWLLMIFGPIFFPFGYQIYCIIIVIYSLLKTLGLAFGTLVALIVYKRTINMLDKRNQEAQVNSENRIVDVEKIFYHVIVIPSYKQDEDVLLETITTLARSPRAKQQFIILLAMEAHEKGSDQKAKTIINKTKHQFLYMAFSQHVVRQGQAKGKASNVSWCVEHLEQMIPKNMMIQPNQILLTIIDADSWAPLQYFELVQIELAKRPEIKDRCMFSVPQIYTRNHLQVPVFNRVYDQMHTIAHLANMVGIHFLFPLSNYTISYNTAKKIGWWDTCADAIGQDFHTCQKCYWKMEGQTFVTVPIFIPFNQVSLSTGEGYINDLKARFWQAERHTLGVCDVAYCWNMLFKTPFMFRNLILTLLVTEVYAMAAVIPWAILALGIQYKLVNNQAIHFFPMLFIDLLLNATPIFTFSSYIFFEWWRRSANKRIWNKQNDKWWRVFQYPILFMVALFGVSVPAFLMASFAVLCTTSQYRVAQKHIDKNRPLQNNQNQSKLQSGKQPAIQPEKKESQKAESDQLDLIMIESGQYLSRDQKTDQLESGKQFSKEAKI